eukprot:scaffold59026_cov19-Prasinocladus_malaysianus.AAC.1
MTTLVRTRTYHIVRQQQARCEYVYEYESSTTARGHAPPVSHTISLQPELSIQWAVAMPCTPT